MLTGGMLEFLKIAHLINASDVNDDFIGTGKLTQSKNLLTLP